MNWTKGLRHPLGIGLLSTSVLLAAMALLDMAWGGQQTWLLAWGVLGYASVSAYVAQRERVRSTTAVQVRRDDPLPASNLDEPNMAELTEAALKNLRKPAFLATCRLIGRLPYTMSAAQAEIGKMSDATPLDNAQLLKSVLSRSLEKLRSTDAVTNDGESLQYHVVHEHYVRGQPASYTMTRHSIAEATFHRYRRAAVKALAADVAAQEEMLSRAFLGADSGRREAQLRAPSIKEDMPPERLTV